MKSGKSKFDKDSGSGDKILKEQSQIDDYADLKGADLANALANLHPIDYAKLRKSVAKQHGIGLETLDREVKLARRSEASRDELRDGVEPWPNPVDGLEIAQDIVATIRRYIVLPDGGDIALALWCIGTYCMDSFKIFPRICLSSPEKRCGKSVSLEVLGAICNRVLLNSNITALSLFRAIEAWMPTMLIDEADTFINSTEELRGIINSSPYQKNRRSFEI